MTDTRGIRERLKRLEELEDLEAKRLELSQTMEEHDIELAKRAVGDYEMLLLKEHPPVPFAGDPYPELTALKSVVAAAELRVPVRRPEVPARFDTPVIEEFIEGLPSDEVLKLNLAALLAGLGIEVDGVLTERMLGVFKRTFYYQKFGEWHFKP